MDESGPVYLFKAVKYGQYDPKQLIFRQRLAPLQHGIQALAMLIGHDHVCCMVGLENGQYLDDIRVLEAGERLAFVYESPESPAEVFFVFVGKRVDRPVATASGEFGGKIFLDGDFAFKVGIKC